MSDHTISLDQAVIKLKAYAKANLIDIIEQVSKGKIGLPPEAGAYVIIDGSEFKIQLSRTKLSNLTAFHLSACKILLDVAVPPTDEEFKHIRLAFSSKTPAALEVPSILNRSRQVMWFVDEL